MFKKRHLIGAAALAIGLTAGLAACAPGGSSSAATSGAVSKDVSGKDVTLKVNLTKPSASPNH